MGLKNWFQKKIKQPLTEEKDEMTASSPSKGDFKKKNFKGLLSEEGKKTSDDNMSEGTEFQSATGEEVVSDVEEGIYWRTSATTFVI